MKKITLLFILSIAYTFNINAQNTCATATPVTPGLTTVPIIDGTAPTLYCDGNNIDLPTYGEWYSFTASMDGYLNILTDLAANAGGDTNVHIYSGTCGALVCEGGNDDIDVDNANYLSEINIPITNAVTYYIAFDDRWDDSGFDFLLTEFNCSYSLPYNENFDFNGSFTECYIKEDVDGDGISWISQQNLDLDGDTVPETFATNGNSTTGPKNDWLFSPALTLDAGTPYNITSIFNTFNGNGSFEAFIVDAPNSGATQLATLFSMTNIVTQGDFATLETMAYQEMNAFTPASTGTYYIAYHSFGPGSSGFILLFDSKFESTLSVEEFEKSGFTYFYNKETDILNLESSFSSFANIEIYNVLGQNSKSKKLSQKTEYINMSNLSDGLYIAKIYIDNKIKTIKIIKN